MASKQISTFVFFDLEATGLADTNPRITELSMVAVHRESLHAPCEGHMPRTLNKLTICIDPQKPIPPMVAQMTGLHNDELSYQHAFDSNVAEMCRSFLSQLASPICLLAHNGNEFDFPLLAAELEKVGGSLPVQVMCADTLQGFRMIDVPLASPSGSQMSPRDHQPEAKAARALNFRNPPQPLRITSPFDHHLPTDVTPEMQYVKQDLKRFSNAPEKRKPKPEEAPRSVRATSIKRKLFGECPNSRSGDMMEDDVDRNIGASVFQMSKGIAKDQSVPEFDSEEDEKMITDEQPGNDGGMYSLNENVSISERQLQTDSVKVVTDGHAAEGVAALGIHSVESVKVTPGGSTVSPATVTGQHLAGGATIDRGPEVNNNVGEHQIDTAQPVISPECTQPMSQAGSAEPMTAVQSTQPVTIAESEQPMTPETNASQTQTVTTPTTVVVSETFLTPSPSPHRPKPELSSCNTSPASSSSSPRRVSYSLAALHRRILGYDFPQAHSAEGDCLALVRLFHKIPQLCEWADDHAVPFNSITPLSTPTKRQRTS